MIPTRNRAQSLMATVRTVLAQMRGADGVELRVMDNGSTDATREVCRSLLTEPGRCQYQAVLEPGLHAARNVAWRLTDAELIAYLDDDVVVAPGWLETVLATFEEPAVMLAGGPVLPEFQGAPPRWLSRRWQAQPLGARQLGALSLIDLGPVRREIPPQYVFGCNFIVRRSVLIAADGFHPDSMPSGLLRYRGDGETHVSAIVAARGWRAMYEPGAGVSHVIPTGRMRRAYFMRRAFAQGVSDSYTDYRRSRRCLLRRTRWNRSVKLALSVATGRNRTCSLSEALSWASGFAWHQRRLHWDAELRQWVTRANYLQ